MNKMLKMCLNWKVLTVVGAVVLLLVVAMPGFSALLPILLFLAICPLMMFLMMNGMMGATQSGSSQGSPISEQIAKATNATHVPEVTDVNPNVTPAELAAELRVQQEQISRRIAELEAGQPNATLEAPAPRGL